MEPGACHLDRHGQACDVQVFHFISDQDNDLRFLAHVIRKADEIREDLGSVNELFDEAAHRRLVGGENAAAVQKDLDLRIDKARGRAAVPADASIEAVSEDAAAAGQLEALAAELDLDDASLRDTLEAALATRAGRPQLAAGTEPGTYRMLNPGLPGWDKVVDESLRRRVGRDGRGAVARLAFEATPFLQQTGDRVVFNPRADVALMHLSHPMLERALSGLTRRRFPGGGEEVSRWLVRTGDVPRGAHALVLLTVEEIAVNELRETFHHWVRTLAFPVNGSLGGPEPHAPALQLRGAQPTAREETIDRARDLLDEVEPELRRRLTALAEGVTQSLGDHLQQAGTLARTQEAERFQSRHGEVSRLMEENTLAKLEREIAKLQVERTQGTLFDEQARLDELDRSIEEKQAEIQRRRLHYEEVRLQLERERERVLRYLLPRRYAMAGAAQVFPVSVEVRLPEGVEVRLPEGVG